MPDIFNVVADPTRRDLLSALLDVYDAGEGEDELSVGELVAKLGISQPTVSKHLRVLRDSGLVATRDAGQHRYYRLDPQPLLSMQEWLSAFSAAAHSDGTPATTSWTPDGRPVSIRRSAAAGRTVLEVGAELGRVMAEASYRASAAISGVQQGLGKVVDRGKRRGQQSSDD